MKAYVYKFQKNQIHSVYIQIGTYEEHHTTSSIDFFLNWFLNGSMNVDGVPHMKDNEELADVRVLCAQNIMKPNELHLKFTKMILFGYTTKYDNVNLYFLCFSMD